MSADRDDTEVALDQLSEILLRIPGVQPLVQDVNELRGLLSGRRMPRLAIIGRRGCGKSSLANALLGAQVLPVGAVDDTTREATWVEIRRGGIGFDWLDTPGLRAGGKPERGAEVARALRERDPDVWLFAMKATQALHEPATDVSEMKSVWDDVVRDSPHPPARLAVAMKCDELHAATLRAPPYEPERLAAVTRAVDALRVALDAAALPARAVVPVVTYWRDAADADGVLDWRWNLDAMADAIYDALPVGARLETARAFANATALRRRVAMRIVRACSSVAMVIGMTPLPIADLFILAPLQSVMISGVMLASGRRADARLAAEWMTGLGVNVGAGVAFREIARAAVRLVPGLGGSISAAIAATGTWALGVSAVKYFVDGGSLEDARSAFEKARHDGVPPAGG